MKLATLTAYIWSGWPRGVVTVEQTHTGHIVGTYTTGKKKAMRNDPLPLCDDWSEVVITQEMFNAELAVSLRHDADPDINYLPLLSASDDVALQRMQSTPEYAILLEQWLSTGKIDKSQAEEAVGEELLAEIARLQIMMREILSVHLTTVRSRKRAARASVAAEKSLVWMLAKLLGAWPSVSVGGTPLYAKCITQDEKGLVQAVYEWEGKEHPWEIQDFPQQLTHQADDWLVNGALNRVTRDQWETACKARKAKDAMRAGIIHETFKAKNESTNGVVDGTSVSAMEAHGRRMRELAAKALQQVDTDDTDKYGD